ncbi:hypothetical protein COLO4_38436 [Corchorus olitorius]|uniref:Pentacotripeptide-repeat region of PRORP domain-containing protein n=1 Tax=Corchorus olitorius TaxID=93759 RepID=A0A1R3FV34_9ROSI|nr:hypothetical protein COLO4_38436 [Corchorus olitorius]
MKSSSCPKTRYWDSLIQGFGVIQNNPDKGLLLLKDCLRNYGTLPSSFTFCSLIHSFVSGGNMNEAIELLELMADDKVRYPFNNFVCSSVIAGFCKIGKPELALGFFRNAVNSGALRPNVVTYTAMLCTFNMLGRFNEACELVSRMESEGLALDVILYSSWICGQFRNGCFMEALKKHRDMVERGIKPDTVSYTILIDGFSKQGNVEKAVGFLKNMLKGRVLPNVVTYTAIISGFGKKGKLEEAFTLFKEVKSMGIEVDEFMYATLIHGACVDGNIVTYSTLLHWYTEEGNVEGIFETKGKLEEAGLCMDVVACNILIKALFSIGAFDDARALYQAMPEMGLNADSVTYCTIIDGYCKIGKIEEALEVFDEYRISSVSSAVCYNCIISGLCKMGMVDMAVEVFIELGKKGLALDTSILMQLILATFAQSGAEGVMNFVYKLEKFETDMYNSICDNAICFLCKRGFVEAASEVYIVMRRKGLTLAEKSFSVMLKKLIDNGRNSLAVPFLNFFLKEYGLVESMFLKKMKEQVSTFTLPTSVFRKLVKDGRVLDVHKLVLEASESFPGMDLVDYSILIDALCKEGYPKQALDLCIFVKSKGITLNIVTYNSVINGLCHQGCLVEAFRLFDALERIDIIPSTFTYAILIDNLCKQGFLLEAKKLFDGMICKGCEPNARVYNLLIDNYCKFGIMDKALKLLSDMERNGVKPDEFTVSAVISGYCRKGDMEGALTVFSEFKMKGLSADLLGFIHMIQGFCAKGRMEEARSILREMLHTESVLQLINKIDTEIESDSVESFLVFLCEQGSIQEALVVLREIKSILLPIQRWSTACEKSQAPNNHLKSKAFSAVATASARSSGNADLDCALHDPQKMLVGNYDAGKEEPQFWRSEKSKLSASKIGQEAMWLQAKAR